MTENVNINLRHSSLRNVIERSFGVLKSRFPIFNYMTSWLFDVLIDIVYAAITIHNFIIEYISLFQIFLMKTIKIMKKVMKAKKEKKMMMMKSS
jgi:hypothetical protein